MEESPNLTSIPTRDEQLLLEKRLRRQTKNKLKKEELKRIKEEEKRRKLYEPKDQRVKVVNQSELATINKHQEILSSAIKAVNAAPAISNVDFPSLGSSKSKFRDRPLRTVPNLIINANDTNRIPGTESLVTTVIEESKCVTSDTTRIRKNVLNKDQLSKPKRKDPIQIDVLTALKKEVPKVQHERPAHTRKEPTQRSGNLLDASNPERKKGKVREIPKVKKPSQLKRVILQERDAKRRPAELIDSCGTEIPLNISLDEEVKELLHLHDDTGSPIDFSNPLTDIPQEVDHVEEGKEFVRAIDLTPYPNTSIHSRKFREYCDHSLSPELDALLSGLITDIVKFQDRAYFNDPIKAHAKRRFVLGFREAKKYLTLKKLKLLILAPDLEKVKSEGGIDDLIKQLKEEACSQAVPYVFGVGRRNLKKLTNKSFKIQGISCIGILNYEGAQDNFNKIQDLLPSLRIDYENRLKHSQSQVQTAEKDSSCANYQGGEECYSEEIEEKEADTQVVESFLTKLKELRKG